MGSWGRQYEHTSQAIGWGVRGDNMSTTSQATGWGVGGDNMSTHLMPQDGE